MFEPFKYWTSPVFRSLWYLQIKCCHFSLASLPFTEATWSRDISKCCDKSFKNIWSRAGALPSTGLMPLTSRGQGRERVKLSEEERAQSITTGENFYFLKLFFGSVPLMQCIVTLGDYIGPKKVIEKSSLSAK